MFYTKSTSLNRVLVTFLYGMGVTKGVMTLYWYRRKREGDKDQGKGTVIKTEVNCRQRPRRTSRWTQNKNHSNLLAYRLQDRRLTTVMNSVYAVFIILVLLVDKPYVCRGSRIGGGQQHLMRNAAAAPGAATSPANQVIATACFPDIFIVSVL